jgi:hypothetical protein
MRIHTNDANTDNHIRIHLYIGIGYWHWFIIFYPYSKEGA